MKYLFILILSLSLFSCKEFECQTCEIYAESNVAAARARCNDQPIPSPAIVISDYTLQICTEAEFDFYQAKIGTHTVYACDDNGLWFGGADIYGTETTTVTCRLTN